MNESEKPFFPDIFAEKIRKCDEIDDPQKRRDCKIDILVDAVKKIGVNQKPVSWWLEVIGEGTKPLFDEMRQDIHGLRGELSNSQQLLEGKIADTQQSLEGKIIDTQQLLEGKIIDTQQLLEGKIADTQQSLEGKIDGLQEKLEGDIKKLDDGIGAISAHLGIGYDKGRENGD